MLLLICSGGSPARCHPVVLSQVFATYDRSLSPSGSTVLVTEKTRCSHRVSPWAVGWNSTLGLPSPIWGCMLCLREVMLSPYILVALVFLAHNKVTDVPY